MKCDSCGRQDDKEEVKKPGVFMNCVRKVDDFLAKWWESGLWFLSMLLIGLITLFVLCYALLHTFRHLKQLLVFKDQEVEKKPFATNLFQFLCLVLVSYGIFLAWKHLREAHLNQRYLNKGYFGI